MTERVTALYAALVQHIVAGKGSMAKDWLSGLIVTLKDRHVDLDTVLHRIVDETTRRLKADRGTLYLVDHAKRELVSRVAHLPEIAEIRLRIGEGAAGWVAEHREAIRTRPGRADPRWADRVDALTGYQTASFVAVPLVYEDTVVGVFQLLNKRSGFSQEDEEHLAGIGRQVLSLLQHTSLGEQLNPSHAHPLAFRFNHIVGQSGPMVTVYDRLKRAAPTDVTVLVRGETGTGKELIARAVHHNSERRDGPLVKVDCAALPESLIENELFGHERGAFTGADQRTEGKVHAAEGGTLFLDEIGELSLPVQGKLLRLLQERSFLRIGSSTPEKADVRFVCATHVDLEQRVAAGDFRRDLYYRLRVVEIQTPPLRSRGHADLDRLIDHFLYTFTRRHQRRIRLSEATRNALHSWSWPGNVRELEHCLESAVVLCPGDVVEPEHLPIGSAPLPTTARFQSELKPFDEVEREYLKWAVAQHDGNRTATAQTLKIGRNTLTRKLK